MERYSSGELDMLPAKRKSPQELPGLLGSAVPAAAGGAGTRPGMGRASCGPTCSSPALGWGLHSAGSCDAEAGCEVGDSTRGKAQRLCSQVATSCAVLPASTEACAAAPPVPGGTAAEGWPIGCHGSSQLPVVSSLLPGLHHSYHPSCCSRLSSSSSLADLEAASVAAAAAEAEAALQAAGVCGVVDMRPGSCGPAAAAAAEVASTGGLPEGSCLQQAQVWTHWPQPQQQRQQIDDEEGGGASVWCDIPDDILKRVLELLQPSTLRVLRLVCRGWEAAASRQLRHLRPESIEQKQLGRRFPGLHSLDLSSCCMRVDFATPRMLRLQSMLRDHHLAELAGLSKLQQLSLRGCSQLTGLGLAHLGRLSGSLTMLNLSNCTTLTNECLAALAAAVPQLATLNLQGCPRLGDEGIAHLAAMPHLRHILLPSGVTDASTQLLAGMPALERVALRGCAKVTTAGIYVLLQRRGLKRVVISKCPQVTLESLCGESNFKVVSEHLGSQATVAAAMDTAAAAAASAAHAPPLAAGMAGHDMQLLVAEV